MTAGLLRVCLTALLLSVPMRLLAADMPAGRYDWKVVDESTEGRFKDLARTIATTDYKAVLTHPEVAARLKALTGSYYSRVTAFSHLAAPIGYEPGYYLVLWGYSTLFDKTDPAQREDIMVIVNWDTGNAFAALKNAREMLVFAADPEIGEALALLAGRLLDRRLLYPRSDDPPLHRYIRAFDFGRAKFGLDPEYDAFPDGTAAPAKH